MVKLCSSIIPPNRDRDNKSIRSNRWFRTAVVAADCNRKTNPETSRIKRRFHSAVMAADQTAVSPLLVKPKEKPRHSPKAIFALNQAHFRACADVSEQYRETNYKTHKHTTRYKNKVQVWNVTCEEYAHICKYAKWVCATKSLQRKLSTRDIPLECLSLEVLKGPLSLILKHLNYPYNSNPNMWFFHEISQSINEIPYTTDTKAPQYFDTKISQSHNNCTYRNVSILLYCRF